MINKAWIISRLKEVSTWRGFTLLFGALGIGIAPEAITQIGIAVTSLIGAVEIMRKEK